MTQVNPIIIPFILWLRRWLLFGRWPAYIIKADLDWHFLPVLEEASKRIERARRRRISFFFANGLPRPYDAVLAAEPGWFPQTDKPLRYVHLERVPFAEAVRRMAEAIRQCMRESDSRI